MLAETCLSGHSLTCSVLFFVLKKAMNATLFISRHWEFCRHSEEGDLLSNLRWVGLEER